MHGTSYEISNDRLIRVIDRNGSVHAELDWEPNSQLRCLSVPGAVVNGVVVSHPLLGPAHAVGDTAMTAIDWARPTEIPAIAEPARLASGAGGAILNTIALLAQRAGVAGLRYAGPYPTPALWRSLARSFRTTAGEPEFTRDALDRALRVARDPIAIEFAPAPHERLAIAGGFVELRAAIERVVIDGIAYEPDGSSARLVDGARCEIWLGDAPYARVATLGSDGALLDGPHPIPACASPVIGREFPVALRAAIAALVADAVAAPLAADARALIADHPLRWADLGARVARAHDDGLAVHAALWDRIAPLGLGRLALALAEALAPVAAAVVVQRATAAARERVTAAR
jgi:hypothetical protein